MSKDTKAKNENVRKARPKTAAQKAKAAKNVALAAKRLKMLQAKQALANEGRKRGIIGTDAAILARLSVEERNAETRAAMKFVEESLAGPHGAAIRAGLNLTGEPCKIAGAVREFIRLRGYKAAV